MKHLILFFTLLPILCFANGKSESGLSSSITLPENFLLRKNLVFEYSNIDRYQKELYFSESEKNNKKTSYDFPWKQTGIYSLELATSGAASFYCALLIGSGAATTGEYEEVWKGYLLYNMLITSTCCYATGWLLREEGSWWKSALGAGIGSVPGAIYWYYYSRKPHPDSPVLETTFVILTFAGPPLGAVIGFNIK